MRKSGRADIAQNPRAQQKRRYRPWSAIISETAMIASTRPLLAAFALLFLTISAIYAQGAPQTDGKDTRTHRLAIQVDQNDPATMNLALNNAKNVLAYYRDKGENVNVEIVAYGPGLNMLRADTSPVKERIADMARTEATFPSKIVYSACNNTLKGMEKREGHPITIIPQARIVPSGVVRIMQLEEQGWSYVRP
jgi:intracellular sulfur oxidation DsrE/DsrF family protein